MENNFKGLTTKEVIKLQEKYGKNILEQTKKESFIVKVFHIICEPMFLLLIFAATIYFILGEPRDGIIMLIFVVGIITIDVIQEWKTDKTLNALKDLSEPKITAIRDGKMEEIYSSELVPNDIMLIHEGVKIPADGFVVKCSGLCVDESSLTGESAGIFKTTEKYVGSDYWRNDYCYQGTLVTQGTGVIRVDKIGVNTEYGKIGSNLAKIVDDKSPLQKQTDSLVKLCAIIAGVLFVLVCFFTFFNLNDYAFWDRVVASILSGITLAMAMIPEEFPVVLTVFLSMGAWRLAKKNSLVKRLPSVETLGAVSVLCVDKTGTITKNEMIVDKVMASDEVELAKIMALSCEEQTFDPMEKAMFSYCKKHNLDKENLFNGNLIKNFPFSNDTKMMGKVWEFDSNSFVAAKGSPESILGLCKMSDKEKELINKRVEEMSMEGLRVIAVGKQYINKIIPESLVDCKLDFVGIVGLIDPPRESVKKDIMRCKKAGVRVIMITGDNGLTASSIASKVGMDNVLNIITGDMINKMSEAELKEKVKNVSIFSRVIPEHKMKIVSALQSNGEIVAMTGDGVNDAPALKKADIGIAMGLRGSEVSREAADLILMDDNFSTIVETIRDGRRIYDNIKKAIGYIFVIHIPIALTSLFGPILGIEPDALMLLPLHVVLLELIIDPTCSVVLERQPEESNVMSRNPRNPKEKIFNRKNLSKSIIQGLILFITSFMLYYYYSINFNSTLGRTMGLLVIMFGNLFLVQVNASDYDLAFKSFSKIMKDKVMLIINLIILIAIIVITYSPINSFLKLQALSLNQFLIVFIVSFISVFWYEIIKIFKNRKL